MIKKHKHVNVYLLNKGRPPGKNGKRIKQHMMFTVFTADMVEEKGAPPGKNGKNTCFYCFYRGYGI